MKYFLPPAQHQFRNNTRTCRPCNPMRVTPLAICPPWDVLSSFVRTFECKTSTLVQEIRTSMNEFSFGVKDTKVPTQKYRTSSQPPFARAKSRPCDGTRSPAP